MRSSPVVRTVCYALFAVAFIAPAWLLSRDGAGPQAVVMAIGAIAFVTMAVVSALTATRSRRTSPAVGLATDRD